jgi:hypothetical protein
MTVYYPPPVVADITDGITIGTDPTDGSDVTVQVAGAGFTAVTGPEGSGTTTLIRNMVLGVGQCRNAVVWMIDLDNGRLAKEFLGKFQVGKVSDPVIDWVAMTLPEATTMLETAAQVAMDRADLKSGRRPTGLVEAADQTEPPLLFIAVASGLEQLAGSDAARTALTALMEDAATCNVTGVLESKRWPGQILGHYLVKRIETRIASGRTIQPDLELAMATQQLSSPQIEGLTAEHLTLGQGWIRRVSQPGSVPARVDVWHCGLAQSATLEECAAGSRPILESSDFLMSSPAYRERWKRTGPVLFGDSVSDRVTDYGADRNITHVSQLSDRDLARWLHRSPSATGDRAYPAIMLITDVAGGALLCDTQVRAALTIDGTDVYIDWMALAQHGKFLLNGGTGGYLSECVHPDAGYALTLAAGLATGRITGTGLATLARALTSVYADPYQDQR